jgi:hypothetical protein
MVGVAVINLDWRFAVRRYVIALLTTRAEVFAALKSDARNEKAG